MHALIRGAAAALLLSVIATTEADTRTTGNHSLVIVHANVIDGIADEPTMNATIIVADGRIQEIRRNGEVPDAAGTVIDLEGRWLLPGFVDAHVHVDSLAAAQRALLSGATTVAEAGVSHFADIGLRELHDNGLWQIPDVVAAGYHVRTHMADDYFIDFPDDMDLMGGAHGTEAVRRIVQRMASRGVDRIKTMSTERAGLTDTVPRVRVFTDEELAAIVDEAAKHDLPVVAHAHGDDGAAAAVRAGVHCIEHGTYLSEDTLRLMLENGTCLDPTLSVNRDEVLNSEPLLKMRGKAMLPEAEAVALQAWQMGIKVVAGTDTSYSAAAIRTVPDEIIALAKAGLPPMDAIKAATSVAAEAIRVGNRTGSIRPGLEADLVVVNRNPLDDIRFVSGVAMVINNGRIVRNDLDVDSRPGCQGAVGVSCAMGQVGEEPGP